MSRRERLAVGGMHCSSCAETIADTVESVEGVESASVNYATDDATDSTASAMVSAQLEQCIPPTASRSRLFILGGRGSTFKLFAL